MRRALWALLAAAVGCGHNDVEVTFSVPAGLERQVSRLRVQTEEYCAFIPLEGAALERRFHYVPARADQPLTMSIDAVDAAGMVRASGSEFLTVSGGGGRVTVKGKADQGPFAPCDQFVPRCPPGALLCDTFEDPALGGWTDSATSATSLVYASTTEHHTGNSSFQARAEGGGYQQALVAQDLSAPSDPLWVRLWVLPPADADNTLVVELLETDENERPMLVLSEGKLAVRTDSALQGEATGKAEAVPLEEPNHWYCVVWHVDNGARLSEVFVEDKLALSLRTSSSIIDLDKLAATGLRLGVDAERSATDETRQLFLDDLLVAKEPLACPR
jgi:hypothetical protein